MNDNELKQLHSLLIMLTSEIDRICKKNNIVYSLTGGSLIGAIRHKGFIPWDDDMDVAMLRDEYEKFLVACETDLDPRFEIQTFENDSNYFYGFGKIVLKDTRLVQYCHERTKHRKGIYVDIFPLDNVPEDQKLRKKHENINFFLEKMLTRRGGSGIEDKSSIKKWIGFHCLDIVNIFFPLSFLIRKLDSNMREYDGQQTELVCNMGGYYGYKRETTYRKYFENTVDVEFEDKKFSIITEYHDFLTHLYGDYMQLPPVEKRHTHGFQELDFGPYKL